MPASTKRSTNTDVAYKTMEVRPIAGALGAEIYGADLRDRANKAMWSELHRAFLEHQVIAVRGQDLSPADQYAVGRFFGEPSCNGSCFGNVFHHRKGCERLHLYKNGGHYGNAGTYSHCRQPNAGSLFGQ